MMRNLGAVLLLMAISMPVPVALADVLPPPKKDGKVVADHSVQPWWDERTAGWLGGLVGGTVGLLGAAFGVCAGLGVARRAVQASALLAAFVGVAILLTGLGALLCGQPYHVFYPQLLIGGITAFVFGLNYPIIKRRNEQIEMQQMAAMDA